MFTIVAAIVLTLIVQASAVSINSENASDLDLQIITDQASGTKLGIPRKIVDRGTRTKFGSHWSTPDQKLKIDTMSISDGTSLVQLYTEVIAVRGRLLTNINQVQPNKDRFIINADNKDGSAIYFSAHRKGGTLKVLQIVYSKVPDYYPVALTIYQTFIPFPSTEAVVANFCSADRSNPQNSAYVAANATTANVGEAVAIDWKVSEEKTDRPLYLVVLVSSPTRFLGEGFYALSNSSAGNPRGVSYGIGENRAIFPLSTAFSAHSGVLSVMLYSAGTTRIQWALVQGGECQRIVSQGSLHKITITANRVQVVARNNFSILPPVKIVQAVSAPYKALDYGSWFEIIDGKTDAFVLRRQGYDPTFSPTGRFLIVRNVERERVEVIDLVASKTLGKFDAHEISWTHGDSFMYVLGARDDELTIVQTLRGARDEIDDVAPLNPVAAAGPAHNNADEFAPTIDINPSVSGCLYCSARDEVEFQLSIDDGTVAVYETYAANRGNASDEITVYDLGAHSDAQKYSTSQAGIEKFETDFGMPWPRIDGWDAQDGILTAISEGVPPDTDNNGFGILSRLEVSGNISTLQKQPSVPATSVDLSHPTAEIDFSNVTEVLSLLADKQIPGLKAPRDRRKLAQLQKTLSKIYPNDIAQFGSEDGYGTAALPDPHARTEDTPYKIELTMPGRLVWTWKQGIAQYFLTQSVDAGRNGHTFDFRILRDEAGRLEYSDLKADSTRFRLGADVGDHDEQFELGDVRTEPEAALTESSLVFLAAGRYLLLATKPVASIIVFDLAEWRVRCSIPAPVDGLNIEALAVTEDVSHVIQENRDSTLAVYDCANGQMALRGANYDRELVLLDRNGYYDASDEAADYLEVRIPGISGRHILSQFAGVLRRRGIVEQVLEGKPTLAAPKITAPPRLEMRDNGASKTLAAASDGGLKFVQVYADGQPVDRIDVSGSAAEIYVPEKDLVRGNVTAFAIDASGLVSAPVSLRRVPSGRRVGMAYVVSVGVNAYPLLPAECGDTGKASCNLSLAEADAIRISTAVERSEVYERVIPRVLLGSGATRQTILDELKRVVQSAQPDDTIVLSFAGHGLRIRDHLILALSSTLPEEFAIEATSLPFERISNVIKSAKARVVVLLDVCHAGLSGVASIATNQEAADQLVTDSGASVVIFSASQGAQTSIESSANGGGLFSLAFDRVIDRDRERFDIDGDGVIDASELFFGLKAIVSRESGGFQIPTFKRNLLLGEVALF
ncbi:caspase family protein [Mesorhizobium sp. M2E.F.Ca.ET.219.01.1.1]|uniref:caspase family protein n=1 Tax=Mesorhizobium sp. M2E.F.Ca.ET.219.01.1.1 TaxID=2500530 RepID=UPI00187D68A6|nr:caspase family protein [Mesorhizobium sp. M2E.F.Ca.ET.219.01.1.1]